MSRTTLSSSMRPPKALKNWPMVASCPEANLLNGWMWIRPSLWVWMPFGSVSTTILDRKSSQT